MAATRVDGTGASKRLPYLLYEVIMNNATTYTLRLSLGVNNRNSTDYHATTESYISKKIGSGAASFVYASSSVRVLAGDTIIISNTTWTITKTHASQSISVGGVPYLDHAPVGSVTKALTVPARTSYSVTYNANSGSGAPAQQTKWHDEELKLSSTKPTKAGYTFKGWAISEAKAKAGEPTYQDGDTVPKGTNSSLTLWAVWELTYTKPQITNLHVERCDENGDIDDEGTIARVTFDWSVFRSSSARYYGGSTTPYASTTVQSCSVQVGTVTKSVSLSGASGSTSNDPIIVGSDGSFLNDTQYNVTVTITDTVDSTVQPTHSSTASTKLATTFFPMDFNANASAVGFFRPAPDNAEGIYFGKTPKVVNSIPNTNTFYEATREDNPNSSIHFGIGSGGVNRGIWVDNIKGAVDAADDNGGWLIYADGNGIIHTFADYEGSITSSITNSWGTSTVSGASITAAYATRRGNVVQLLLSVKNNNAIAAAGNWFEGTVAAAWRPKNSTVQGVGYYGARATIASLGSNGHLIIRNASTSALSAKSSSETSDHVAGVSITYIVD